MYVQFFYFFRVTDIIEQIFENSYVRFFYSADCNITKRYAKYFLFSSLMLDNISCELL